ncbi:MAG: hypothetical protein AAGI25_04270 [Bacteroidota bacterium]
MAIDHIIVEGDKVEFSSFTNITLIPAKPSTGIRASGKATINGKKVCVEGDEKKVTLQCSYTTQAQPMPGVGELTIQQLAINQLASKSSVGGKPILLAGSIFNCQFKAIVRAMNPQGVTDPVGIFFGQGKLIPTNNKIKAN